MTTPGPPGGPVGPAGPAGPGGAPNPSRYGNGDGQHRTWEQLVTAEDHQAWLARTRVNLTPIAAPSIMGLFGFLIATGMLGSWQAGWYGDAKTPLILWPFALFAGGVLQSIGAIASFRARDGVALGAHTAWGAFWIGWGILQLLVATHVMAPIALGSYNPSFGFWFVMLTVVTGACTLGALAKNVALTGVLGTLTAGSALTAAAFFGAGLAVGEAGGILFVISAALALYVSTALILENAYGRTMLPLGTWSKAGNLPIKGQPTDPLAYPSGMPGVKVGQ